MLNSSQWDALKSWVQAEAHLAVTKFRHAARHDGQDDKVLAAAQVDVMNTHKQAKDAIVSDAQP